MNLIDLKGRPQWGRLSRLPADINWRDFDARDALGRPRAKWLKPFLFKHFDFYGAQGQGFTLGVGMVRLGLVNSAFGYLWDDTLGLVRHVSFDLPGDLGLSADVRPLGHSEWKHPLKSNHRISSHRTESKRQLHFELGPDFMGVIELDASSTPTLALNTPIANTGFAYAQKTSGTPVSGQFVCGGQSYNLDPSKDGCYHDWTAGLLRRETFWNWACATGARTDTGQLLSLNLARGVNETSAHENVLWMDGQMFDLPLALFEYDRDDVLKSWKVYSQCGAVDLQFTPFGQIQDHRNLLVLASRFNQCFGVFEGTVKAAGQTIRVAGLRGWCEDHYAKW